MNIELLPLAEAWQNFNIFAAIAFFIFYLFVEIVAIVSNYLYIVPVALGAALGSFLTVEYEKKKRPLEK